MPVNFFSAQVKRDIVLALVVKNYNSQVILMATPSTHEMYVLHLQGFLTTSKKSMEYERLVRRKDRDS